MPARTNTNPTTNKRTATKPAPTQENDTMPAKTSAATEATEVVAAPATEGGSTRKKAVRRVINGPLDSGPVDPSRLVFTTPPKAKRGGGKGRQANPAWYGILEGLKANPGEFALVGSFLTPANRPKVLKDAGCDFTTVRQESPATDGEGNTITDDKGAAVYLYDLYAAYPVS